MDEWKKQKEVYQNPKKHKLFEIACSTFYLNRCNRSGIIAGAHLVGHGGVKTWLDSNGTTDVKDGNGVCVSEYMEQFAGYDIKDSVSPETIVLAMN